MGVEEDALKLETDSSLDQDKLEEFINSTPSNSSIEEYEKNREKYEDNRIFDTEIIEVLAETNYSDFEPQEHIDTNSITFPLNVEEQYKDRIEINEKDNENNENILTSNNDIVIDEDEFEEVSNNLNLALQSHNFNNQNNIEDEQKELLKKKSAEESEKENRNIAIKHMSSKYGLTEIEVKEKIQKYVDFTQEVRKLEQKEASVEFIKKAIEEKKKKEEDDVLTQGILKILNNVQNDIQNDNFLESIDKNSVYKNIFLKHIKTGILDYINHSDDTASEKDNIDKKEIFDIFVNRYNLKISELNKNSYIELLLKENSIIHYMSLISYMLNNDLVRNEIKVFIKEIEKMDFSLDKIYYI